LSQDFRGKGSYLGNIFFDFYKTRHILLSDSANCIILRSVVLTPYRRVTDRRTDGIAVASTSLAMRALRRAVTKTRHTASTSMHSLTFHFAFALCCHSNATPALIANPPNSAQLRAPPTIPQVTSRSLQ